MLDTALLFFQEELNSYIKLKTGGQRENIVQFAEIQLPNDMVMQNNAVTLVLVNLEEERLFRSGSLQTNRAVGSSHLSEPDNLCLNFHLLFVSNFKDYIDSVQVLSLVLKFFRSYRVFTHQNFPVLSNDIEKLSTEFVNLTFMEQGELWRSLSMPSSPSALYKIRMLVFQDSEIDAVSPGAELSGVEVLMAQN